MTVSFRTKLFLSYALLALLMVALFYAYSNHFLKQRLVDDSRLRLQSEAQAVRLLVEGQPVGSSLQGLAERLGGALHARVTLVGTDGRVLADSGLRSEQIPSLENHLSRPEVGQALSGGIGSAVRYSETLRMLMLYVAVPYEGGVGRGAVRLAVPLSSLETARSSLHLGLGAVTGGMLMLALLFSAILSGLISRPLRAMADAAARFGAGDWRQRVPVVGDDEGAYLGQVLNRMADRIEQQMLHLKEERQQLDTILQSMGEGVVVLDPIGRIILANASFRRHFGLQGDLEGLRLAEACRNPDLLTQYRLHRDRGGELTDELSLPSSGITFATHWVTLGTHEGSVAVFHDISELKRLEGIRRDFVANVSHELRTPVTVIKGYAETLLDGRDTDPATSRRFVDTIHGHAARLASLIGDLLALSELEAANFRLELSPLDLHACARKVCGLLEGRATEGRVALVNEIPPDLPPVQGNQPRLEQVFFNLIDNAVTYSAAGGIVTITALPEGRTVAVSVCDTGQGIAPEHLPRLFERFYRVDASRSREHGGTGLGLAIVKHIVHLHGGSIKVTSTPGVGSVFTFTLPTAP